MKERYTTSACTLTSHMHSTIVMLNFLWTTHSVSLRHCRYGHVFSIRVENSLDPDQLSALESSGSESTKDLIGSAVAQCLTRDRGAAGSSLTGVTAWCP